MRRLQSIEHHCVFAVAGEIFWNVCGFLIFLFDMFDVLYFLC